MTLNEKIPMRSPRKKNSRRRLLLALLSCQQQNSQPRHLVEQGENEKNYVEGNNAPGRKGSPIDPTRPTESEAKRNMCRKVFRAQEEANRTSIAHLVSDLLA
jgi:hypothetical protein